MSACRRHYPGEIAGCVARSPSPETLAFPVIQAGRLPHHPFRGLLDVHSNYGPLTRQVLRKDPLCQRLWPFHYFHDHFGCYRLERELPDGI